MFGKRRKQQKNPPGYRTREARTPTSSYTDDSSTVTSIVAASADQEACVCDLVDPIGLSQPTVSHHLKVLTEAGFLSRSKRRTWAYYRLVPEALERVSEFLVST